MIPDDPFILLSFINTKLRDEYASLPLLCEDLQLDQAALEAKLRAVGYAYREDVNRFV